jgi:hypothetical protein
MVGAVEAVRGGILGTRPAWALGGSYNAGFSVVLLGSGVSESRRLKLSITSPLQKATYDGVIIDRQG